MHLIRSVDESSEAGRYFITCARIRDISVQSLMARLVNVIATDQLVGAILDDDGAVKRNKGEHHHQRKVNKNPDALLGATHIARLCNSR